MNTPNLEELARRAELSLVTNDYLGHPKYVVSIDGESIGHVFGFYPTFERRSPGARVVSARWTSKSRYWVAEPPRCHWNVYRLPYRSRAQAVRELIAACLRSRAREGDGE
jgi:hypothetical protein